MTEKIIIKDLKPLNLTPQSKAEHAPVVEDVDSMSLQEFLKSKTFSDAVQGIGGRGGFVDETGKVVQGVLGSVNSFGTNVVDTGQDLIDNTLDVAHTAVSGVNKTATDFLRGIINAITFQEPKSKRG